MQPQLGDKDFCNKILSVSLLQYASFCTENIITSFILFIYFLVNILFYHKRGLHVLYATRTLDIHVWLLRYHRTGAHRAGPNVPLSNKLQLLLFFIFFEKYFLFSKTQILYFLKNILYP